MTTAAKKKSGQSVSYILKASKRSKGAFSNVVLPNGQIIRQVDERVHQRALFNASKVYKEKA